MDSSPAARLALGLDIGGANLKAAISTGEARACEFPLWKQPAALSDALRDLVAGWPRPDCWAVTITGELADCFRTKAEGIERILVAVQLVAGEIPVRVWGTSGRFCSVEEAVAEPLTVAAANWHAQATWIGSWLPEKSALLIDIGSTTSDLIPLQEGRPATRGVTDVTRLQAGELVYTGAVRTPVAAVVSTLLFLEVPCPVAAELFATVEDAHLLLGNLPEHPNNLSTANGRPATKAEAYDRLVRQICCDRTECSETEAHDLACQIANAQIQQLQRALQQVLDAQPRLPAAVVISGSGAFLAEQLVAAEPRLSSARLVRLDESLTPEIAEAACAYAIAKIATQVEV